MSIQAITCAMALRDVSPSEKLLLLALANYADENMRCFPSQRRLAEDTCLTARTIRSLLARLELSRIISRTQRERSDGSRGTDVVTLHFVGLVTTSISGGAEMVSGGVGKPLPGGAEMVSGPTTFEPSPEPSIEPIEGATRAPRPKARRQVPETWSPSEGHFTLGADEGFTAGEIEREIAKFRDHEFKTPHVNWDATFRKWIRTAAERNPRKPHERSHPDPRQTKFAERLGDIDAAMEAAFEQHLGGLRVVGNRG